MREVYRKNKPSLGAPAADQAAAGIALNLIQQSLDIIQQAFLEADQAWT